MKLSGVPEKDYNSRPSEFGGFWLCACIRAIPTYIGASVNSSSDSSLCSFKF